MKISGVLERKTQKNEAFGSLDHSDPVEQMRAIDLAFSIILIPEIGWRRGEVGSLNRLSLTSPIKTKGNKNDHSYAN